MNLAGAPDSDPARREVVSIEPHRSAALRFMGSLDLQFWTRIGTMNLAGAPDSDPARRKGHFHRAASECGAPVHGKPRRFSNGAWGCEGGRDALPSCRASGPTGRSAYKVREL